ncbi:MAG: 2-oxoacid:acceptor oxidoreductase [Treponemataceae bacterium]
MKKRNDATLVTDVSGIMKIFPYIMKRRSDSLVYHRIAADMHNAIQFVRNYNRDKSEEEKMRVFDLIIAALGKLMVIRPKLNRFIANYETWQRNNISLTFVVKEALTEEAPERTITVNIEPEMNMENVIKTTSKLINEAKTAGFDEGSTKIINKYMKLPKFLIKLAVSFFSFLDKHGCLPASIREFDGMHASAILANLGSIRLLNAPFHHLYEWGTTSMFLAIGSLYKGELPNQRRQITDIVEFGFTVDERIVDGFYTIQCLNLFQKLLKNPELLLEKFSTPVNL